MNSKKEVQHVYLVGAKSLGAYGGYETFVYKLTEYHQNKENIKYHVACKANGDGCMDESKFDGVTKINEHEFELHNAHCFKIDVPQIGPAQAIYYDVAALKACCEHIKENHIPHPIVYIMACRIGPFAGHFYKEIHKLGGTVYLNPDGHEWMRAKWSAPIRKYWKISEQMMVKYCDLAICDSVNIEKYIHECYDGKGIKGRNPKTTFIAYGADLTLSKLADDDEKLVSWYKEKGLTKKDYYLVVGRFVPENSFEVMIREFMKSKSQKDFAIITNVNDKFLNELEEKLHFKSDKRIKFVGTVYDQELLKKIRENAYGNIEVILVDDGSPDKSGYIIDRLKEEDNRIVVIHQENHGVSSARNAGMAVASGEYITFVDGDDWVDANYVTYFVDLLEKSSCDVVMNKNNYSGCNDISNNNFSVISAEKAIEWIYLGDLFVAVWNKMYRRSVLEENYIKFNEKIWYGEGMLFNVEFLQHVNSVAVGESAVYHQTFNPDSAMRKFNLKSNLCGIKSLELQKEAWIKKNIDIEKAWEYHRYCFNRSIIDGLVRSNMILEYNETYKECVSNLRKNIFLPLKMEKSIKKKIMWCCYFISPRLMAIRKAIGFKKAAKTGGGIRNNVIIEKTAYILVPITGGAFA